MERWKTVGLIEKLDKGIGCLLVLLAVSSCISEPMSRNAVRLAILLGVVRLCLGPEILYPMKKYTGIAAAMAAMAAMLGISAWYSGSFMREITGSTFWYNYNMLLFFLAVACIRTRTQLRNVLWGLLLSLLAVDLYIYWQAMHGVVRPNTFMRGNFMLTAMFYVILLPGLFTLLLQKKIKHRRSYALYTLLSLAAIFINSTRGAWLALLLTAVFLLLYYRKLKQLLVLLCTAGILLGGICMVSPVWQARIHSVTDMQDQSHKERLLMWQSALHMAMDHPLLGVGLGNYTAEYQQNYISPQAKEPDLKHAHSNFFQFLAEDGLFGLAVYCGSAGYILYWFGKRRKNFFAMMAFSSSLALLIYSTNDYTFAGYAGMRVYWLLLGLCARGIEITETDSGG